MPASPPADALAELALLDAADRNRRRAEWRVIWAIATAAAIASFFFGASLSPDPDLAWLTGVQGAVNALIVSLAIGWLEVAGGRFRSLRFMRAWPLWAMFLAKLLLYVVLIVASTQIARLLFYPVNPQPFGLNRVFLEILLFASAVSLVANVTVEIGQLVGFRELGRLLTGRYLKPRLERRVFLMVDLKGSTEAAERLGDLRFHELLNAFFSDIAGAAYDHGAEVHKYVGDEAILTWPEDQALRGARCALCPFGIARRIERDAADYRRRFGLVPAFRAALHAGEVVAGEMGAMKREIAFIGDTLNTAARLMGVARERGHDIVVSGALADRLQLPAGLIAEPLEPAQLRGKAAPLAVSALRLA